MTNKPETLICKHLVCSDSGGGGTTYNITFEPTLELELQPIDKVYEIDLQPIDDVYELELIKDD